MRIWKLQIPTRVAVALALTVVGTAHAGATVLTTAAASAPVQIVTVDPRVPHPTGTPCIVQLIDNQPFSGEDEYQTDNHFTYMPPPACKPPWSKVVLQVEITSSRHTVVDDIGISLEGVPLFHQAAPRYDAPTRWHAERDLTDYSALLTAPHIGSYWTTVAEDTRDPDGFTSAFTGTARLLFYPQTAGAPTQDVPDAVFALDGATPLALPHNIVRAYLDVDNAQSWWYFCVPDADVARHPALFDVFAPGNRLKNSIFPHEQECPGGSFREIAVDVDGTPAGIAPVFPLLPADPSINYFHNALNMPTPTPQMLNIVPYRVDLSPFAGQLDAAGPHLVSVPGVLLVYLDRKRSMVSGGVTFNTLAGAQAAPTFASAFTDRDQALCGKITTLQSRQFEIRGFVNSSLGRVDSAVKQSSAFENVQSFDIRGPIEPGPTAVDKLYQQTLSLRSTTTRASRWAIGGTLLGADVEHVSYPLAYRYHMATNAREADGWYIALRNGTVTATQGRVESADHYRPGRRHYTTRMVDYFAGTRTHAYDSWGALLRGPSRDSNWRSVAVHRFTDNFGSCYTAAVGALNGAVWATSRGIGCPDERNSVRWFAHPDGSPDSLGWWH